jgi:hypothetical protein
MPTRLKALTREHVPMAPRAYDVGIRFLTIEPTIVYDAAVNGTAYQGVKLSCERGAIGVLTLQEYYATTVAVKGLLMSLAASSDTLLLLGMLYLMGGT